MARRKTPLPTFKPYPHVAAGLKYAREVVAGKIPACKWVRLACQRQIDDLQREGNPRWPYRFDPKKAERVCRFIELLPHTKGKWAHKRERIKLEPWQQFGLTTVFGWVKKSDGLRRFREAYKEIPRKNGKALEIDTPVPTPLGWKRHGDLQRGDYVFSPHGEPIMVLGVTEQYSGPCMQVDFSDGASIVAHDRHEWITRRTWYTKRPRGFRDKRELPPVETREISATLRGGARGDFVHRVKLADSLVLPDANLPVPPYTFGAWLGDGTSLSGSITCADHEIIEKIRDEGIPCRPRGSKGAAILYGLTDGDRAQSARDKSLESKLRKLGVLGSKHIPSIYLRASRGQRLEVLRGLVDTDGHITPRGQIEITTISPLLCEGILELIRTLGMKPTLSIDRARLNGKDCGDRFRISFFSVSQEVLAYVRRKRDRQVILCRGKNRRSSSRTIVGCRPIGDRMVNCITVEGGLYLAGRAMIPTHNSIDAAAVGLYMFAADGEFGAEVYSGATTEKQAWEVFRPARLMALRTPEFREAYGIDVNAGNLSRLEDGSRFEPLIGKPGDGSSPSCAIIDEFHEHDSPELYDTMITGQGARDQPLTYIITTAGANMAGPCYDKRAYAIKVLEGTLKDESLFAIIYSIDEDDDWTTEEALRKANPNLGVSVGEDYLYTRQRTAMQSASQQNTFKTKHLNIWVGARNAWMNMRAWQQCPPRKPLSELAGRPCYAALDLASKVDVAAEILLFPPHGDDPLYHLHGRYYLPEDAVEEKASSNYSHYATWAHQGFMTLTPGNVIDFDYIMDDLRDDLSRFEMLEVPYDPWQATQLATQMLAEGAPMVELRQTVQNLSEPMKELEKLVLSKKLAHGNCPVMSWMVSNVVAKLDKKDNIYPTKEKPENKIDGAVGAIMALARAVVHQDDASVYETRGLRTL